MVVVLQSCNHGTNNTHTCMQGVWKKNLGKELVRLYNYTHEVRKYNLYMQVPAPSLEAKLAKNNLQREVIIDHDGNGNSFFNAVSQALAHKTNYTPTELRKMLVEHLKTNPKLYYPRSGATTTEEYNKLCSLDDSLSSNIEKILPEAMAQTLRMQIKVIPVNHEQEDKFYGTEPVVQLIHAIDHYDYVLPITSPGDTTDASSPGTTETPLKSSESLVSAKGRRKLVLDTDTR